MRWVDDDEEEEEEGYMLLQNSRIFALWVLWMMMAATEHERGKRKRWQSVPSGSSASCVGG